MAGIAGIIRFDGKGICPAEIEKMIGLLRHRGNLSQQVIKNGILLSFGGTFETPHQHPLTVVADADVYTSKFSEQPFSRNYAEAGPASFDEPNADFAVALWDDALQALYCARDIVGIKPLYYVHQPNRFFAFASEIKGLTVLSEVKIKANRHKFREYLTWHTIQLPYSEETFYEDIYSVLPGHYLKASPDKTELTPYWKPDFSRFRNLGGIEEYALKFRSAFTNAVADRIKNKQNIGSHLSGGLDSSSVSSVSQSLLIEQNRPSLNTFNIDTEQPLAEEQRFVQDVVNRWQTNHFRVLPGKDILGSVQKINYMFDRPDHLIIPSSVYFGISAQAEITHCELMLSGHGGDNVAAYGFSFLNDLMDAGNWDSLKVASEQYFYYYKNNKQQLRKLPDNILYKRYLMSLLIRNLKKRYDKEPVLALLNGLKEQKDRFGLSAFEVISYLSEKLASRLTRLSPVEDVLNQEFKKEIKPREFRSTALMLNGILQNGGISVEGILNHSTITVNEQMNHIGAYYKQQQSFPFLDKRVIELCLSTPDALSFDSGRGRGLIRHGMQHLLPPSVISRTTKANFIEYGTLHGRQLYNEVRGHISNPAHAIWEIVDREIFLKMVSIVFDARISDKHKARYNWLLSRTIYLSVWLDSFSKSATCN